MKPFVKLTFGLAAALLTYGCGGQSSKLPTSSATLSKAEVAKLLSFGIDQSANIRSGGKPSVMPNQLKPAKKEVRRPKATREPGDQEWHQFNDYLGLWEYQQFGVADDTTVGSGFVYFLDEAKTQPAGYDLTWSGDGMSYPLWVRQEVKFDGGNLAGEWHKDYFTNEEDGTGTSEGSGHTPAVGDYTYSGNWDAAGRGLWNERFDGVDKSWQTYQVKTNEDFSETYTLDTSQGLKLVLTYGMDLAGTGTISGPSAVLPAKIEWNAEGIGTVTWADGSITEFTGWDFFAGL